MRRPGDAKFALGPHTDGGSVERWEDPEYSRVYTTILQGKWEEYDPFDARHRIAATMDMYNGPGACSMFQIIPGLVVNVIDRTRRRHSSSLPTP